MRNLGVHILIELNECAPSLLVDVVSVREKMLCSVRVGGGTIIGDYFKQFEPYGVSGMVVIAESHVSIHTWPEHSYAAVDVFTCGSGDVPYKIAEHLIKIFKSSHPVMCEFKRGLLPSSQASSLCVA